MGKTVEKTLVTDGTVPCPNKCEDGKVKQKNEMVNCPVCGGAGKLCKTEKDIEKEKKLKEEKKK